MAVILTNMDMPKCCLACKYQQCFFYGKSWATVDGKKDYTNSIDRTCLLKSVEELIEAIERLPTQENSEGQDMYQAYDVLRTIREYCGMED